LVGHSWDGCDPASGSKRNRKGLLHKRARTAGRTPISGQADDIEGLIKEC